MFRCFETNFHDSQEAVNRLFECNRVSTDVWNHCLKLSKETHLETGKWVTKSELQKGTKGFFSIHSQSIQTVCHKYLFARKAAHAVRN